MKNIDCESTKLSILATTWSSKLVEILNIHSKICYIGVEIYDKFNHLIKPYKSL